MRLTNRNKAGLYNFLSTLSIMSLVVGVVAFLLEHYKYDYLDEGAYLFIIIPIAGALSFTFVEDKFLNMIVMVKP